MREIIRNFERLVRNPYLTLLVGVVLLFSTISDSGSEIYSSLLEGRVLVHHGVIVLGLAHIFRALPGVLASLLVIVEGEERIDAAKEQKQKG